MKPTETLTFLGTIAELKAVLKASKIKHSIKDEDDAYLEVDLKGPIMTGATIDFYGSRDKANERYARGNRGNRDNRYTYAVRQNSNALAKGIIKGTGNGSTVDLEVDLETDETMPMHKEVHEHWQQFYAYLVSRGRLAQEPEAAAQTEIDGRPEPAVKIQTEDELREAIENIVPLPGNREWWEEVAKLFFAYKRVEPKYTYGKLAAVVSMDEKHVGKSVRGYSTLNHPKSPYRNTPKKVGDGRGI